MFYRIKVRYDEGEPSVWNVPAAAGGAFPKWAFRHIPKIGELHDDRIVHGYELTQQDGRLSGFTVDNLKRIWGML